MKFEDWVTGGGPRLVRYAYLISGDRDLAEDLVQDVLVDAFSKWDRISYSADIDSYLRRAVINRRISWWRRTGLRETLATAGQLSEQEPPAARPELWAACLRLPERQRAAVVLRYYEEREFVEIADILGVRESSVRGLVSRGVAALKTSLSEEVS